MDRSVQNLSNQEVTWEGTYIGLTPTIDRETVERLSENVDRVVPELIARLSDEGAFVAAHVLLTQLSGIEYEAFPTWNGLRVEILTDGSVRIDPAQRSALARRWERWARTDPRPSVLPAAD